MKKEQYNRLVLEANELKALGKIKLANDILNSLGPNIEEQEFASKDIVANTKKDIINIIVKVASDLDCNINSNQINDISELVANKLIASIENIRE